MLSRDEIIDGIIKLEWKQFQAVQNEGGRADCQDNYETFEIMRKSQYLAWTDSVLESYLQDILDAEAQPWNLITEKYARMMESTAPKEYEKIKPQLPERSPHRIALQEKIIAQRVKWEEEFAQKYPALHTTARAIHTSEDTPWDTSMETYARGELGTYSDRTIGLYSKMIEEMKEQGKNLSQITVENMVKLYGYKSLEDAEEKYSK